jgi:ATP/maltotriose-dependent transcriptional regulator MalT
MAVMQSARAQQLQQAKEAMQRHAWSEAFQEFSAADAEEPLDPRSLEGLATAAFWSGRADNSLKAWERAYAGHLEQGDRRRAAAAALQLARRQAWRLSPAQARGWRATAERLLSDQDDCRERGQLLNQESYGLILLGEFETAHARAAQAFEVGARCSARDIQAAALNLQALALVRAGEIEHGLRLLDESLAAATAVDLDPLEAGLIYCHTIGLCRDLADFDRAREVADATTSWCEEHAITAFPGICRVYQAELHRLRGDLARAETEVQAAIDDLLPRALSWSAMAFNELGMVQLRRGRLDAAGEAFDRAQELGMEAEPGRSLVHLAEGRHQLALAGLTRALERPPAVLLDRARLLSALVEVALATGNHDTAASSVADLESIAEVLRRPAFVAFAKGARGELLLGEGKPRAASDALRDALELWLTMDAPYEAAQTRLLVAEAYRAEGDQTSADRELELAARAFERIGATREKAKAEAALKAQAADPLRPLTRRQREVARLVAEGQSNHDIAATLVVSERTAEYHVQQILNTLGFDSRAQIAAWYAQRR